jgi:hypothetical protein
MDELVIHRTKPEIEDLIQITPDTRTLEEILADQEKSAPKTL